MNSISKSQLRHERLMLNDLIKRYGNITLLDAHDCVSVALDFYRGSGRERKKVSAKRLRETSMDF